MSRIEQGSTKSTFRPDLQGLRAFAVAAVIVNHVVGWPSGGFVGVDIFFVLSGFLITGLILREYEENGRVSLAKFYGRRIRRIVPTAATVLVVTATAGYFLFNKATATSTIWDSIYAFFFVANWHLADIGTDYFQTTGSTSPLQHYWSLAVEEQFYLLWPWLMLLGFFVAATLLRKPGRVRLVVGLMMAAVVVASFGYALWETGQNSTVAYFSTFSRAWELGVGALLAAATPVLSRIPGGVRTLVGWVGLAAVVASVFVVNDSLPFPGPAAAIPVGAAALVIAAGIGGTPRFLFPLTNPVSVFFGNISYSLYLWHFPIAVFLLLLMPDQTVDVTLIVLGMILVVSILSYYLIEQPLHRSPLFESFDGSESRSAAWQMWRDKVGSQSMLSLTGIIVVATVVVFAVGVSPQGFTSITDAAADPVDTQNLEIQLQAELAAAVSAMTWPDDLSPSLDDAIATTSSDNAARACFDIGDTPDFDSCTWGSGDAPNHMYLVGDSEALSYAPAFKAIAEGSGGQWQITTVGLYGCRFTDALVQNDGKGVMEACAQRKQDVAEQIRADNPQLVVVANAFALGNSASGGALSASHLVTSTFTETAKYNLAGRIVYLAPPPLGADLAQCYSAVSSPQTCNATVGATWQDFAAATQAASATGDYFVSSLGFSCVDGICPAFAGTIPTKYDSVHMTATYSAHIAPAIQNALVALGLM